MRQKWRLPTQSHPQGGAIPTPTPPQRETLPSSLSLPSASSHSGARAGLDAGAHAAGRAPPWRGSASRSRLGRQCHTHIMIADAQLRQAKSCTNGQATKLARPGVEASATGR